MVDYPFKPSEYLKSRRPEQYSDSEILEVPKMTRDLLEFHLDTLTSRGQEKEFEHFARRLAEKEICPNLVPQTGPSGGGDGKVDTETFPVSEEIAAVWYIGRDAAQKRWAFAISAKKDWAPKCRSDVKNIVGTDRGYDFIFFITNQSVRSKAQSDMQDDLTGLYGIPVTIIDRNWIVTRVIEHDHIALTASALNIESLERVTTRSLGPMDAAREIELKRLDEDVSDVARFVGVEFQRAELCLEAAVLACELERPRAEIDARFDAAASLAEANPDQRIRVLYKKAWATCFYFDDLSSVLTQYRTVESLVFERASSRNLERLLNLWMLLRPYCRDDSVPSLSEATERLRTKFEEVTSGRAGTGTALIARAALCQMDIIEDPSDSAVFDRFAAVVTEGESYAEFPFLAYHEMILGLEAYLTDPAFDRLGDLVVELYERRTSTGQAGCLGFHRAVQRLRAGRHYDAIRLLGVAQSKLVYEEYSDEFVRCLLAQSGAYRAIDLQWAARTAVLAAISLMLREHNSSGYLDPLIRVAAQQLAWIELKVGRIPQALYALIFSEYAFAQLGSQEEYTQELEAFEQEFDPIFAILLLTAQPEQVSNMSRLVSYLDGGPLAVSTHTLGFLFGHYEALQNSFFEDRDRGQIDHFFEQLASQPAREETYLPITLGDEEVIVLKSCVLGMALEVHVTNDMLGIRLAETILTVLEAFLATSLTAGIYPFHRSPRLRIELSNEAEEIDWEVHEGYHPYIMSCRYPRDLQISDDNRGELVRGFVLFVTRFIPKISVTQSTTEELRERINNEEIIDRAALLADMAITQTIFRDPKQYRLSALLDEEVSESGLLMLRDTPWIAPPPTVAEQPLKPGVGDTPSRFKNMDNFRHSQREIFSVIYQPAWDRAGWAGAYFVTLPDEKPGIGLVFRDRDGAIEIFKRWQDDLVTRDELHLLRVCVIRGVDAKKPNEYLLSLRSQLPPRRAGSEGVGVMFSRSLPIDPEQPAHLERFLRAVEQEGGDFEMFPVHYRPDGSTEPLPSYGFTHDCLDVMDASDDIGI